MFHAVYATTVFVVAYVLIATERFNKTLVALAGATAMFFLPLINSDEVFYSRDTGVNWDVLFLLLGMMIIVSVVRQTGAFEYVAIWSVKRARGSLLRIMILLMLVTALGTAVLDNVTTVLLIAPVTLLVCDRLAVSPAPFLVVEALTANIAGAATLVGDPTSIIIGTGAHLSFITFTANMAPAVLIVLAALVGLLPRLYPGFFAVDPQRVADVMSLNEREAIGDHRLLAQCGIVLTGVLAGFVMHQQIHMEPSLVAMTGAGILIVASGLSREFYLSSVEWETLLFFAGLFVMVGALVRTGVIKELAELASQLTRGDAWTATILILSVSFTVGSFINNVPYAATMTPIVGQLAASMPGHASSGVLWWALLLGTVLGGNLTPIGASANVVVVGIAQRAGSPVSFWDFTRRGAVVTAVSFVLSLGYLWLRYFALG
ncbi:ArsB/NhaD family transporter [Candidatus Mycobacterium methanotrophicum]|uniref:ArsB/NhaD family transporter n=1 Tax=Candidatus Mycobacterium methanotrophicum TaxID=2943498 RepID=A0ABY4QTK0_9MYCO|nr:ArsB/NhaD family transporter [Candidatus Mycobacterium methanotrophicum]UQX13203.1 ArsB/NhaD family transporter [Candidatus Mycobacterium methanotrophicum]